MPELKIDVSEAQIHNAIAVGIADAFSPEKRDAMLRDVIRAHLEVRANSYDKETLLSKTVGETVRKIAVEQVQERLQGFRPEITAIITKHLGAQFKESMLTQLEACIEHRVVSKISISAEIDRD